MIFIESDIFNNQINNLSKKFPKVKDDFNDFKKDFNLNLGKNLGKNIYKFRIKNSSIPVGKRGGFRIILYFVIHKNKILPILIYSKTDKESSSFREIFNILEKISKSI